MSTLKGTSGRQSARHIAPFKFATVVQVCVLLTSRKIVKKNPGYTSIEQGTSAKGRADPASVHVLVRSEAKRTERGSVVRTFILHVLHMTVDMLHGDRQPPLGLEQKLLVRA